MNQPTRQSGGLAEDSEPKDRQRDEKIAACPSEAVAAVRGYHERSKHRFDAYAPGPETIDWSDQPEPFRRFAGCAKIPLATDGTESTLPYADLYAGAGTSAPEPHALNLAGIARLLRYALGLSAWKQYGTERWSQRVNPSSGNLHPTEAYLIADGLDDLSAGVYHYQVHDHQLETRGRFPASGSRPRLFLGLSSVHWREAWKYGLRAYRYCQLDTGHAVAALAYSAALLGWRVRPLVEYADADVGKLLGIDRSDEFHAEEYEYADLLLSVEPAPLSPEEQAAFVRQCLANLAHAEWSGTANLLDPRHYYRWPEIDEVANATDKPASEPATHPGADYPPAISTPRDTRAAEAIRVRRSAQAFDGKTVMAREDFYSMLDKLLPRDDTLPWYAWPEAYVHPVLFVHRVEGLPRGIYALPRSVSAQAALQAHTRGEFAWREPEGCPAHLPLYFLLGAKCEHAAASLACHQAIAADSAFSMAMLAEYERGLEKGAWVYRHMYWEAGMLGQVLYLEAEAMGLRGTGIGCFFDDHVHELLGLVGNTFQDVYHFTVGMPIVDQRITSLPPYAHLDGGR